MQIENPVEQEWSRSTQDWIDYRYGEILLNYAEAIIEKSEPTSAEIEKGKKALNEVRKRAAHKDEIALTQSNVRKERFVELAFENKRRWDLVRWRTFHKEFQTRTRKGLVPFIDLRKNPPCYIFVRVNPLGLEAKRSNIHGIIKIFRALNQTDWYKIHNTEQYKSFEYEKKLIYI